MFLASNELRDQQLAASQARTEAPRSVVENTGVSPLIVRTPGTVMAHPLGLNPSLETIG
jgi:hypothetical protein